MSVTDSPLEVIKNKKYIFVSKNVKNKAKDNLNIEVYIAELS